MDETKTNRKLICYVFFGPPAGGKTHLMDTLLCPDGKWKGRVALRNLHQIVAGNFPEQGAVLRIVDLPSKVCNHFLSELLDNQGFGVGKKRVIPNAPNLTHIVFETYKHPREWFDDKYAYEAFASRVDLCFECPGFMEPPVLHKLC